MRTTRDLSWQRKREAHIKSEVQGRSRDGWDRRSAAWPQGPRHAGPPGAGI